MKESRFHKEWQRLCDTELQALELKEAGTWPLLFRVFMLLLVFGVALALMYGVVIKPRIALLSAAEREESSLLTTFRQKALETTYLPDIEQQLADMDKQMQTLRAMLPTNAEMPSLLDSISESAVNNRLSVDTIRLRETSRQPHFEEHPFELDVQGHYHDIARFVADIAALPRIVTQHDFVLEALAGEEQRLRLVLLARTYSDLYRIDDTPSEGVQGSAR